MDTGKRIAVEAGDIYDDVAREILGARLVLEFTDVAEKLDNLKSGVVDAALMGEMYIHNLQDTDEFYQFDYIWLPYDVHVRKAAPVFHTAELRDLYNEWFEVVSADGTWDDVVNRWLRGSLPAEEDIPRFELTGENGILQVADTGNYPPMSYIDSQGEVVGFDMDMIYRFAQYAGMQVEISLVPYYRILQHVSIGRVDMSACTMSISDERSETVYFGQPSVITHTVLIIPGTGKIITPE